MWASIVVACPLAVPLVQAQAWNVDDIQWNVQVQGFRPGKCALRLIAGLVVDSYLDRNGVRVEGPGFAGEATVGEHRDRDIEASAPGFEINPEALKVQGLRGGENGGFGDESVRAAHLDGGGNEPFRDRFAVQVPARVEVEAHDELSKDPLAKRAASAVDSRGDANFRFAPGRLGSVLVEIDASKGGIQENLGAFPLLVGVVKELGADGSGFISDVRSGKGDSVQKAIFLADRVVENSKSPNDCAVDIRKKREGNRLLFGEFAKGGRVVVGDGDQADSRGLEFRPGIAQLAELRPTGRSPDRGAVEDDRNPRGFAAGGEFKGLTEGVGQGERGEKFSDLRACRMMVGESAPGRVFQGSRSIEVELVSLDAHAVSPGSSQMQQEYNRLLWGRAIGRKRAAGRSSKTYACRVAFGGMGVSQDTPIQGIVASSRYCQIADGPDEVHMSQLGKLTMRGR